MAIKEEQQYATFWQRLQAHNIDLLFLLALFYLTSLIPIKGYDYILLPLIYLTYNAGFESSKWRATPGKKWMKLCVTFPNKSPAFLLSIFRNLVKFFSLVLFFAGFIMIHFTKKKQGLHDLLAGSVILFHKEIT